MMEKTQKTLKTVFIVPLVVALLMALLFETGILTNGVWASNTSLEFVILSVMELLTICLIPIALRLFKTSRIKQRLHSDGKTKALLYWGSLRLAMLCVPLLINTLFYYLFMNVAFGYMAIILAICMCFVWPSMQRCLDETSTE